jgi:hypothetical protein
MNLLDKILRKFGYVKTPKTFELINKDKYEVKTVIAKYTLSEFDIVSKNMSQSELKLFIMRNISSQVASILNGYVEIHATPPQFDNNYRYTGMIKILVPNKLQNEN